MVKLKFSTSFFLTADVCYRTLPASAFSLQAVSKVLAPHTSSELLLGNLNWFVTTTPSLIQSSRNHKTVELQPSSIGLYITCCDWFAINLDKIKILFRTTHFHWCASGLPSWAPHLFSIYISDVVKSANSQIHLYADDTNLYLRGPSLHSATSTRQLSLNSEEQSFDNLHLCLNAKKDQMCYLWSGIYRLKPPKVQLCRWVSLEFCEIILISWDLVGLLGLLLSYQ